MEYPNTWREDRKTGKPRGSFQGRRRQVGARPPSLQATRRADYRIARSFAGVGVKTGARFIPYVGLALLAIEAGWWYYQNQLTEGRFVPYDAPEGWKLENANCHGDEGSPRQYYSFSSCIGPFAFVREADSFPWGAVIPEDKTILHRLYQQGTQWKSVKWWTRDGSIHNQPGVDHVTKPVIPLSPINPWQPFDPMDIPLQPSPQVVPDPFPVSPFPRQVRFRRWRSPTEGSQSGPVEPRSDPKVQPTPRRDFPRPGDRPADVIDLPPKPGPATSSPGRHEQEPPGPKTRERKGKLGTPTAFNVIRRLFEEGFEVIDYIEAIYDALPDHIRKRNERGKVRLDPIQKIKILHENYLTLNLKEMIENLLYNELEDYIFGRLGKASQKVAQELNLFVGPQFGSGSLRAHGRSIAARQREADIAIKFVTDQFETFK